MVPGGKDIREVHEFRAIFESRGTARMIANTPRVYREFLERVASTLRDGGNREPVKITREIRADVELNVLTPEPTGRLEELSSLWMLR